MADAVGHPFLTSLQYAFAVESASCLVMDLAAAGNLSEFYKDHFGSGREVSGDQGAAP